MFNYTAMIKRAIEFFPLWTDIRKRYTKSTGGQFLSSSIEETIKTEDAIQEYINSYFLSNYIGHEDEVMAYAYMALVGDLKDFGKYSIIYDNTVFTQVYSIKNFEEIEKTFFYENGKIYIKVEDYIDKNNTIQLYFLEDGSYSDYEINKVSVWNIFDEYATFVNTRRYDGESNKSLLERILYITENLPNGTANGIKHAIVSELKNFVPDITIDEITLEQPTSENLLKPYEDYETLLDLLAEVNRDVYRTKRWDIDYWEYEFESISYIPHVWDKVVKDWQNGVGSYNDLEVILTDSANTTDATIYFYKKTLEAFQKYIYDKHINNNIHFTLTKYNDILNRVKVKYKITASEMSDITNENIALKIFESNKATQDILIQDIAVDWGKDIEKIDNNIINDIDDYYLSFTSSTGYDLVISKAKVIYTNNDTEEVEEVLDLLEAKEGFVLNSEYEIVSDSNKAIISSVEHFTSSNGLKNENDYMTLDDGYNEGTATYSLSNKGGLYVNLKYDCDLVSVPNSLINSMGGYWNTDNKFVIRGDYSTELKILKFKIDANYLSFKIDESLDASIQMTIQDELLGTLEYDLTNMTHFESQKTDKPRIMEITINMISIEDIVFSNFEYNNYSIELSTKYGSLPLTEEGYKLSNFYINDLYLKITARSGCNPRIYGIYIGESFNKISYITSLIPYKNNCSRLLEIVTNGKIDLYSSADVLIKEDYRPYPTYKGLSDMAQLRIDLSAFESIDKIELAMGKIETIKESGMLYYNIKLKKGQTVDSIKVTGTRIKEARHVPLEDMIRFYVPDFDLTYDTIYCCRCSKGLILGRSNPGGTPYNIKVNIRSDAFTGINAIKYEIILPKHLGSIFGSDADTSYESRSSTIGHSFDYISIYPAGSNTYQALNSEEVFIQTNRWIPMANNFDKELDFSKLLFYSVELFDETLKDNVIVKFHNADTADRIIYDLDDWSIGTSNTYIAIENNIDLLNEISYELESYDVEDASYLSSTIDIKDSYEITNQTILNTEYFIVEPKDEGVTVEYEYYSGSDETAHLLKYEEINIKSDGFNKLTFSNIDTVYHISTKPFIDDYMQDVEGYKILKDQGIIVWNNNELIQDNSKIYLIYSIKKPKMFVFDLEFLYKAIDYDVEAYEHYDTIFKTDMKHREKLNLNTIETFESADLVYVSCTEPTFEALLENNIITFNKYIKKDTLLVKTGYYYINGQEYYLFSEDETDSVKNNKFYNSHNVGVSGGEFTTYKPTNNYIANSEMRLKGFSQLYKWDCSKPLVYGISRFNNITSCESFNGWNTFGMKLALEEALNGLGLKFTSEVESGYSFIDVTNYLTEGVNYISFYSSGDIKVYLGYEESYLGINFDRPINITIDKQINEKETDIYYIAIEPRKEVNYFLVVQGEGLLDDIIVSSDLDSAFNSHRKNISLLGLDLYEKKAQGSQFKMMLETNKDYTPYHAGLMSNGYIKTTSSIDWYITEIKKIDSDELFRQCYLSNIGINADHIFTTDKTGTLETAPIQINELININRLIIKINNVNFDNMKNFITKVYTSNKYNGEYTLCASVTKNQFHLNSGTFNKYIKLQIQIPPKKYIEDISIFAEYTSTDESPLNINIKQSGYILSKVYDLQENVSCKVKSLDLIDISNINDVNIQIRCSRDPERLDVWEDWRNIELDSNFKVKNKISFSNTRFLQFKIVLNNRNAFIKLSGINIEIS